MGLFNIFTSKTGIVVKTLKSKGANRVPVDITIGDIQQGFVWDSKGYRNEIVLFLRKAKKDRE